MFLSFGQAQGTNFGFYFTRIVFPYCCPFHSPEIVFPSKFQEASAARVSKAYIDVHILTD